PDPSPNKVSSEPVTTVTSKPVKKKPVHPRQNRKKSPNNVPTERQMHSIGEQLGYGNAVQKDQPTSSIQHEKPADISDEEVDAWLQVFHDPVESYVPPPKLRKKSVKPSKPTQQVVRKEGDLTEDEVSAWLAMFPEQEPDPGSENKAKSTKKRKYKQRKLDTTLAEHKAKLVKTEDSDNSTLSDQDIELWQRMFGTDE
ncbi:MAG: hypothetical protein P1S60_15040, partial [Anaerolineae bacterium]|nr:hypothetical protein [Anaerolineae bacterium]